MMRNLLILAIFALFLSNCGDSAKEVIYAAPAEYQPLKIGAWYIYDVDSITYNDFTTPVTVDTIQFQLKEEITDTFTDQAGKLNFRLERSKRFYSDSIPYNDLKWKLTDIWKIAQKGESIERIEENNRYVSLVNPVKNDVFWDGNAFNSTESREYAYQKVAEPFENFGNTVTVNQLLEDEVKIIYQLYEEVYAKDIGMINRIRIDVESQDLSDATIVVLDRIEKGTQYFQKINSYYIP